MAEPDWLTKARSEGRITEKGVNRLALADPAPKSNMPFGLGYAKEEDFQKVVCDLARQNGCKIAHFRKVRVQRKDGSTYWETPVAEDGTGWPDLFILLPGSGAVVAELKVGNNTPSPEQWEWIKGLRAAGLDVRVWYPSDWDEIVETLSAPRSPEAPSVPVELLALADDGCPHHEEKDAA